MRKPWTSSEIQFLVANAGKISRRDICQMLKRSSASVSQKAKALRRQGVSIDLSYYEPTLDTCPMCGHLSGTLDRHGICKPCRMRDQLSAIQTRISDLLAVLPVEERAVYEKSESIVESSSIPLPTAPNLEDANNWARGYRKEKHALAVEQVVIANLKREVKAAQKRKERIEKKTNK